MKKKTKSLATVNVILKEGGNMESLTSFRDNRPGNVAAEALFTKLVRKHTSAARMTKDDVQFYIDEGSYEDGSGVEILLVHSTNK